MKCHAWAAIAAVAACAVFATSALAATNWGATPSSGRAGLGAPPLHSTRAHPEVRGWKAKIIHGVAYAPSFAPTQVKRAIWAGDRIRTASYCYGGGHGSFRSSCYDCSGSVSYVLHGAGLLKVTMVSTELESWGRPGRGRWINVWGSGPHAFMEVAGIVFDTAWYSSVRPGGSGPRWQPRSVVRSQLGDGNYYVERHPAGL